MLEADRLATRLRLEAAVKTIVAAHERPLRVVSLHEVVKMTTEDALAERVLVLEADTATMIEAAADSAFLFVRLANVANVIAAVLASP